MTSYYVPYSHGKPAAISVNGHRLIILSREKENIEEELETLGAEGVEVLRGGSTLEAEQHALNRLARIAGAGIVIAPEELELSDVIKNLEMQLPWVQ